MSLFIWSSRRLLYSDNDGDDDEKEEEQKDRMNA